MEKDDQTMIDPELGLKVESSVQIKGAETESGSDYPIWSDCMVKGYVPKVRRSEANVSAVSTRSKGLKSSKGVEAVVSNGEVGGHGAATVYAGESEGNFGDYGYIDGELIEVEVREEPMVVAADVARRNGTRRFTRSVIKSKDEKLESEVSRGLQDAITLEVEGLESGESNGTASPNARQMEIPKKTVIKGTPTTVKELLETGLLEGYPVFYNGGKRGFPLRGILKDTGILCSCRLCKGVRVVSPYRFEIHARTLHRRASRYICLENGKSLLDVVKECQKSSVTTLESTIHKFVGPMPVKESVICMNCQGPFIATASKVEPLCDSCMIIENSEVNAKCTKSRLLEPLLGSTISDNGEVQNTSKNKSRGRERRKHLELASNNTKSPQRSSLQISTRKDQHKKKKMFSRTSLPKPLKSGSAHMSMKSKRASNTNKDQKMHRLVFEDGGLPDGTEVAYYSKGKKLRDGYKMGSGIICRCCSTLVSPSQFEAHAGRASLRKPYMYIYISNGVSLHEFDVSLWKRRKLSAKNKDDSCLSSGRGKLVLCDGCPRAFHKDCASLLSILGKWYCKYCQNKFQKERDSDVSKSGFGPRTVLLCDQCEK